MLFRRYHCFEVRGRISVTFSGSMQLATHGPLCQCKSTREYEELVPNCPCLILMPIGFSPNEPNAALCMVLRPSPSRTQTCRLFQDFCSGYTVLKDVSTTRHCQGYWSLSTQGSECLLSMDFGANGPKAAEFSEDVGNRLRCFLRLVVMGD